MTIKTQQNKGFTLIELTIVMVAMGFVMVAGLQIYKVYTQKQAVEVTYERMNRVVNALQQSFSLIDPATGMMLGHYPKPGLLGLPRGDSDEGVSADYSDFPAMNSCNNGLCLSDGARDVNGDGSPDPVLIGSVPYKTLMEISDNSLDLTGEDVYDAWGNKLVYAVTSMQTDSATFDNEVGAIGVETEFGDSLLKTPGSAHMLVMSMGPDGVGAFKPNGNQPVACTGAGMDIENCDMDADFISGLISHGEGATHFDDYVMFKRIDTTKLWETDYAGGIYNLNPGFVGVHTDTPTQKLDVNGSMEIDNTQIDYVCNGAGTACFRNFKLGGSGMKCTGGKAVTQIKNGDVVCDTPAFAPLVTESCPPATPYMQGISLSGDLICTN